MGIGCVLFDAVGTLIYPWPPAAEAYFAAGQRFGSAVRRECVEGRFREAFQGVFARNESSSLETDEQQERRRWRSVVEQVFNDVAADRQEELFRTLWAYFGEATSWRLFPDATIALSELARRGYELGIASNFDRRLRAVIEGHPALAQCRHVFVSSEIGFAKPSPRFYQSVQQQLSLPPEDILLVGDDLENDVLAPRRLGWQSRFVCRGDASSEGLSSLAELLETL